MSQAYQELDVSTHDLTKRSTWNTGSWYSYDSVSTHDLTKRSTTFSSLTFSKYPFQLTTSRRGRPILYMGLRVMTCFNSRPHEEVDEFDPQTWTITATFQLTTSRRGRRSCLFYQSLGSYVSTHDLTKRSTVALRSAKTPYFVSTHDLTKRSTFCKCQQRKNTVCFNSRPHEEVDLFNPIKPLACEVSTHDLTKRSTGTSEFTFSGKKFQLTTSRRGRHLCQKKSYHRACVSTHDLTKRSTLISSLLLRYISVSTHDLTKRSTRYNGSLSLLRVCFNSRPHEEVDISPKNLF